MKGCVVSGACEPSIWAETLAGAWIRRRVAMISWMPESESKIQLSSASDYKQFSWSHTLISASPFLFESGFGDLNLAMPDTSIWRYMNIESWKRFSSPDASFIRDLKWQRSPHCVAAKSTFWVNLSWTPRVIIIALHGWFSLLVSAYLLVFGL